MNVGKKRVEFFFLTNIYIDDRNVKRKYEVTQID